MPAKSKPPAEPKPAAKPKAAATKSKAAKPKATVTRSKLPAAATGGRSARTRRHTEDPNAEMTVLAFRFVLRIMGKCASRSGSNRDPDCGMVYGGMKRAWSSLKEFPGTESFVPTFPHRLNRTSRVDSIPGCCFFSATCRSNLHEHGRTGQARARVERATHSTFISTRYVLDPTTGFVSCGVKK